MCDVIAILSSDDEEESFNFTKKRQVQVHEDEVSLIPVRKKRKLDDDAVILINPKDPLHLPVPDVTLEEFSAKQKKVIKEPADSFIDLLSDAEEDHDKPCETNDKPCEDSDHESIIFDLVFDLTTNGETEATSTNNIDNDITDELLEELPMVENVEPDQTASQKLACSKKKKKGKIIEEVPVDDANDANDADDVDDSSNKSQNNENTVDSSQLNNFLELCLSKLKKTNWKEMLSEKFKRIFSVYNTVGDSSQLTDILTEKTKEVTNGNVTAVISSVSEIYNILKSQLDKSTGRSTEKKHREIQNLENILTECNAKIIELEEEEVNFEEENDSSYIKMQRYREKAAKVHAKLCKLKNEDQYKDRFNHRRLDFADSKYDIINIAVNKKYKKDRQFPSFQEFSKFVHKTVKKSDISIKDKELEYEIRTSFQKLGELLKRRRQIDTQHSITDLVVLPPDPAQSNPSMREAFDNHKREQLKKEKEIMEKFCRLQDTGDDPELSADSDDSNLVTSEDSD